MHRFYAIIDRATLDARNIPVTEFASELRDAGVTLLQYRDKENGPQEILWAAEQISAVFKGVDATLILNDRADMAALAGWGVHVGQEDLSPADAKVLLRRDRRFPSGMTTRKTTAAIKTTAAVIGVSTHNEEQVIAADRSEADYIAVGPVFATATKENASPVVGLEGVRRARALTQKPIVAIGGITRENAHSVIDAGADSVAVIGGLFSPRESVEKVARDFLEILR
jgi:thiamine-phosphate pyrophosphorylase